MNNQFVHLHVHTKYSLLDGASKINELISYAKELKMPSIAITDHGVMYGAIKFYQEALKQGIKPIIGCEVYITSGSRLIKTPTERSKLHHLVLLAENKKGYQNLMKIVSIGHIEGFYYKPRIDKEVLRKYSEGLICLSACIAGEVPSHIIRGEINEAEDAIKEYIDIFGKNNYFLEIQNHGIEEELLARNELIKLAKKYNVGLVATNDLHYVKKSDAKAQDVLLCIQTNSYFDDDKRMKFPNDEFYLKSYSEMLELFPNNKEALDNTVKIANRCNLELEFGHLLLPEFPLQDGLDEMGYLRKLCLEAIEEHYGKEFLNENSKINKKMVYDRLEYELGIIQTMGYPGYFLIVWDFINYCRNNDIPVGPGRGSAAGSIVAYLLKITTIDPLKYDLLFERFLNPERISMPDIDVDICYLKREMVVDYLIKKYGSKHIAQIITFGTLAAKAAVKDVGRALKVPLTVVAQVNKLITNELGITIDKALKNSNDLKKLYHNNNQVKQMLDLARTIEGAPRHTSTHAAGVIITPSELTDYVPIQRTADSEHDYLCTQYDKDDSEGLGLLKMDLLGLRTLTVIDDCVKMVSAKQNHKFDIDNIDLKDPLVAQMLTRGDTAGVFQMESKGMTQLIKNLRPETFEDLIPLVALYRPGPLGTGMVEEFIDGRHGKKVTNFLHPLLEPVLKDTFGVILYQEQVMQITSVLAGFSLGEADILRRAMGKKKTSLLAGMRQKFVDGARKKNNIENKLAEEIFDLLQHFAGYGFNKSHSAAYAYVAYQTAYLKAHFPVEFMAALLNSYITAADRVSWYINVCKNMNIDVLPPDVNTGVAGFSVDGNAIRFGLGAVKTVGEAAINAIIESRKKDGKFNSLIDFCERVSLTTVNKRVVENLVKAGAMDSFGIKRAQLLAVLDKALALASGKQKDLLSGQIGLFGEEEEEKLTDLEYPDCSEVSKRQILSYEKELLGFYVSGHPLDEYQSIMNGLDHIEEYIFDSKNDGKYIRIGGIISNTKIRTTRNGSSMANFVIEDFGAAVQALAFPKTFLEFGGSIFDDSIVTLEGRLLLDEQEPRIVVTKILKIKQIEKALKIFIRKGFLSKNVENSLNTIFSKFHGNTPVYLHLIEMNKIIRVDKKYYLDINDSRCIEELKLLFGERNIII